MFGARGKCLGGLALSLMLLLPMAGFAATGAVRKTDSAGLDCPFDATDFYEQWVAWRLSLGATFTRARVRHTHVPYDPSQENNFLGNLNDMHPDSGTAFGLIARYEINSWIAVEVANDFQADFDVLNHDGESCDGTLQLRGWRAQAIVYGLAPEWIVRPYLGLGAEHVGAGFRHSPWWHYGWSSPEDYRRYGNGTRTPRNGVMRFMDVEDPGYAPALTLGVCACLHRHVQLDAFMRWSDSDDARATFRRREGTNEHVVRTGAFPTSHVVYGLALCAIF